LSCPFGALHVRILSELYAGTAETKAAAANTLQSALVAVVVEVRPAGRGAGTEGAASIRLAELAAAAGAEEAAKVGARARAAKAARVATVGMGSLEGPQAAAPLAARLAAEAWG
jgi:hypothetical protein